MLQGTELGEAIAARDAGSFRAAVTADFRQVKASRILAIRVDECRLTNHQERDRTPSGLWPSDHAGVLATVYFVRE